MRFGLRLFFFGLLAAIIGPVLQAQMDTGTVLGAIRDASGAVVPNASVTLINEGTAFAVSTASGPDGSFIFTPVKIGAYTVTSEATGFKKETQLHVTVNVQQRAVVDFTLTPGAVSETVEVMAAPALLQAHDASVGQVISPQAIRDLPLNGRNYTFLAQTSAGVTVSQLDSKGFNASGSFSANGQRPRQNNYILDGIDNNNVQPANSTGTDFVVLTPVDALQEFKIQTGDYSAEFGRAAGAVINATIKSGTNEFHGDVWEFLRNDKLDAPYFFENVHGTGKGEYRQNQYGGTFGGPVTIPHTYNGKDKTFFFFAYQGTRVRQAVPATGTVPTLAERNSGFTNFSDLLTLVSGTQGPDLLGRTFPRGAIFDPATTRAVTNGVTDPLTGIAAKGTGYAREIFPGNIIPASRIDPVGLKLLNLYPAPTASGFQNDFFADPVDLQNAYALDLRGDQNFSQKDQTFLRFSMNKSYTANPPIFGGIADGAINYMNGVNQVTAINSAWSETHTFAPTLINEFRLGFTRILNLYTQFNTDVTGIPAQIGIGGIPQTAGNGGLPNITIGGLSTIGAPGSVPNFQDSNVWDAEENLTKVHGHHSIKMGMQYENVQIPYLQAPSPRGSFTYSGLYTSIPGQSTGLTGAAQVLLAPVASTVPGGIANVGGADSVRITNQVHSTALRHYWAFYAQDNWKITPKLTLDYGLRYEYTSPYHDLYGGGAMFVPGATGGGEYLISQNHVSNPPLSTAFTNALKKDGITTMVSGDLEGFSDKLNFAPRIGIAYQITHKLVFRSGFGIFYGGLENNSGIDHMPTNSFPYLVSFTYPAPDPAHSITPDNSIGTLANGFTNVSLNPSQSPQTSGFTLVGREYNYRDPYTEAVNAALQYQIGAAQTFSMGYVGSVGHHMLANTTSNAVSEILPTSANPQNYIPYPDFTRGMVYTTSQANSNYHSLQVNFERKFSGGFGILNNYTWSKCRTDARDLLLNDIGGYRAPALPGFGIQADYALCDFDVRQIFHSSGTYELPFGSGRKFLSSGSQLVQTLAGGWAMNGILTLQDGQPFTVPCGVPTTAGLGCYALMVPGQSLTAGPHNVNQWMNPAAFANPKAAATIGQTDYSPLGGAATQLAGPGIHTLDFSLFKRFEISERRRFEFRGEFFNIFNHPNFGAPNTNLNVVQTFGQITATRTGPRLVQLALKFYF
jgi:hypothetical protein